MLRGLGRFKREGTLALMNIFSGCARKSERASEREGGEERGKKKLLITSQTLVDSIEYQPPSFSHKSRCRSVCPSTSATRKSKNRLEFALVGENYYPRKPPLRPPDALDIALPPTSRREISVLVRPNGERR